jgi:DNA-binding beta-propeller fold protein YncE
MRFAAASLIAVLALLWAASAQAAPGDVYVADEEAGGAPGDGRIFRLPFTDPNALSELSANPLFGAPRGMTLLRDGRLAVVDGTYGAVYGIDRSSGAVTPILEGNPLDSPSDVAQAPDGSLLVAEAKANVLVRVTPAGTAAPVASFGDPSDIAGVAVLRNGTALVSEPSGVPRIYRVSPTGAVTVLSAEPLLSSPGGLALSADESKLYVADSGIDQVIKIDMSSGATSTFAPIADARDVATLPDNTLLATGGTLGEVFRIGPTGAPVTSFSAAAALEQPIGIVVEPALCAGQVPTIIGTDKRDVLRGSGFGDVILALGGKDRIRGLGGNDVVCGGPGKDKLFGGAGRDRLLGQAGKDLLAGGKGKDRLRGGPGRDTQKQ